MRRFGFLVVVLFACCASVARADVQPGAVAAALKHSPLYVDPSVSSVVRPAQRAAVVKALKAAGVPVHVAVVPLLPGDQFGGDATTFLNALRGRLGEPGIYVTTSSSYLTTDSDDSDLQQRGDEAAYLASFAGKVSEPPIGDQLLAFAEKLRDPKLDAEYNAAQPKSTATATVAARNAGGGGSALVPIVILVVVVVVIAGLLTRRRRGARVANEAPPMLPERVFEHARRAELHELHERASDELINLGTLLDEAPPPRTDAAQASLSRALDDQSAASRLLDARGATRLQLAAALVLIDDARRRLGGPERAVGPLCFFDPLHGRATGTTTFAGGRVAACAACRRTPAPLLDGERPWYAGDGAIARSGLNQLSDDLAPRLLRGERP